MRGDEAAVACAAPAKINLYLHVVGRRADGLHALDSVFVFTELGDRLTVRPAETLSLTISGEWGGEIARLDPAGNLALDAARRLAAAAGETRGAALHLEKAVPVAAGLGGGSSDAAAALKACAQLWGLRLDPDRLRDLAMDIGADVPACLAAQPARIGGAGEDVTPIAGSPPAALLLVNPRYGLPTAEVFAKFRESDVAFSPPLTDASRWSDPDWLRTHTANDLEPAAISIAPVIGEVLATLRALPGVRLARMSGSGASCFALFGSLDEARRARERIRSRRPSWWSWAGHFAD